MYKRTIKSSSIKFRIELSVPTKIENIPNYCDRFANSLSKLTKCVGLTSKTYENESGFTGFDRNILFLENHNLDFQKLDLLYHLTCYDVNVTNLDSKLKTLKQLGIKKLLVITGEDYDISKYQQENQQTRIYFKNSTELIKGIISNKQNDSSFSVSISGYPSGPSSMESIHSDINKESESNIKKLTEKIAICKADKVYAQCVMEAKVFEKFRNDLIEHLRTYPNNINEVDIVPSVAIFSDLKSYERVKRLTRVGNHSDDSLLLENLNKLKDNLEGQKKYCKEYLLFLIKDLIRLEPKEINICPFGLFEFTQEILNEIVSKE